MNREAFLVLVESVGAALLTFAKAERASGATATAAPVASEWVPVRKTAAPAAVKAAAKKGEIEIARIGRENFVRAADVSRLFASRVVVSAAPASGVVALHDDEENAVEGRPEPRISERAGKAA